jgi:DNA repair photolyase
MAAPTPESRARLRWRLADEPPAQAELFPDGALGRVPGTGEFAGLEFLVVRAGRVINEVPAGATHLPFRFTVNAYRGCSHACSYCFARPTHTYLGLDAGDDFDRRIVVKIDAPEVLAAELRRPSWRGDAIAMGTNTDPYQRCEGRFHLTRRIVEVLVAAGNPFSIVTKSTLVLGDLELLADAARRGLVRVDLSVGTVDEAVWRATEPGTPHPRRRLEAVARLRAAGIPAGVLAAPVLPGLSDHPRQLDDLAAACAEVGVRPSPGGVLFLKPGVREVYLERLARTHPDVAARTAALYTGTRAPREVAVQVRARFDRAVARHAVDLPAEPDRYGPGAASARGGRR